MEAILVSSSPDQSISPYKQIKNQKRNTRSFISRRTENLAPTNIHGGGFLFLHPPSLSYSYPPSFPLHSHQQLQQQQPPLLPLPITRPYNSLPPRSRDLSCPPASRKLNRTRDQSLTPKKAKKPNKAKEEESKPKETIAATQVKSAEESLIVSSTNPLGPDPNDLPKDIIKVLSSSSSSSSSSSIAGNNNISKDIEMFSGSVFTISPPPSSLPLPKFSIRPKLSCNAEAAGIDAGATDNLRRLLRLR